MCIHDTVYTNSVEPTGIAIMWNFMYKNTGVFPPSVLKLDLWIPTHFLTNLHYTNTIEPTYDIAFLSVRVGSLGQYHSSHVRLVS